MTPPSVGAQVIAACVKWTPSLHEGDPHGSDPADDRFAGVSAADRAALEVALQLGDRLGLPIVAVAAGPTAAERVLRDALAAGADRAIRLDMPTDSDARDVAFELAQQLNDASVICCGDYSLDRGSGSVPAFLAHHRRAAQALGLVAVDVDACSAASLHAIRRLDGGRRELLRIPTPCVLSVEGSVATLRRASLPRALASRTAPITVVATPPAHHHGPPAIVTPYRPRARVMPAPAGDDVLARLRRLTDTSSGGSRGEMIELDPPAAAARIVDALRAWGYLPDR